MTDLTPDAKPKHWLKDLPHVTPGSSEHGDLLAVGYGLTVADAKEIVAAHGKKDGAYSLAEVRKAQALLEAHAAKPVVLARRPMWKRPLSG